MNIGSVREGVRTEEVSSLADALQPTSSSSAPVAQPGRDVTGIIMQSGTFVKLAFD
jgi:hypothetical protein